MRSRPRTAPAAAAAATALAALGLATGSASAAPAGLLPTLDDVKLTSDCGPEGQDLGKAFHLSGPLPIDHSGCAAPDGQTLRVVPTL